VPTTNFADPVHVYFVLSESVSEPRSAERFIPLFNALLYELEHVLNAHLAESEKPPASSVTVIPASLAYPWAAIRFQAVTNKDAAAALVDFAVSAIESNLGGENSDVYCAGIKSRWAAKTLAKTGANDGTVRLMLDGLYSSGKSFQFLENYIIIENSKAEEYYRLLSELQVRVFVVTNDR
jgi:hypothetical protein